MSHPSYSEDRHRAIVKALESGMSRQGAAAIGGITSRTLRNWIAESHQEGAPEYLVRFAADVELAEGTIERDYCETISRGAKSDWRAAAWWLERRRAAFRETKNLNVNTVIDKVLDAVEKVCGRDAAERVLAVVAEDQGEGAAGETSE